MSPPIFFFFNLVFVFKIYERVVLICRYMVCISAICAGYAFVAAVSTWVRCLVTKVWLFFVSDQVLLLNSLIKNLFKPWIRFWERNFTLSRILLFLVSIEFALSYFVPFFFPLSNHQVLALALVLTLWLGHTNFLFQSSILDTWPWLLLAHYCISHSLSGFNFFFFLILYLGVFLQIVAYLMVTSGSAVLEILYLAYNGDKEVTWSESCSSYGKFCHKMKLAVILHALALCCFIVLAVISAYRAFSTFEPPFVPSKEVEDDTD